MFGARVRYAMVALQHAVFGAGLDCVPPRLGSVSILSPTLRVVSTLGAFVRTSWLIMTGATVGGGCAVLLDSASPRGMDCTAIIGVADVSCSAGACLVKSCVPGYQVSPDGTFCMLAQGIGKIHGHIDAELSAAAYGLEHIPM